MTSSEDVGLEDSALLGCPHLTMWMQSTGILTISTGLGPSDIISYYIKCHIVKENIIYVTIYGRIKHFP